MAQTRSMVSMAESVFRTVGGPDEPPAEMTTVLKNVSGSPSRIESDTGQYHGVLPVHLDATDRLRPTHPILPGWEPATVGLPSGSLSRLRDRYLPSVGGVGCGTPPGRKRHHIGTFG